MKLEDYNYFWRDHANQPSRARIRVYVDDDEPNAHVVILSSISGKASKHPLHESLTHLAQAVFDRHRYLRKGPVDFVEHYQHATRDCWYRVWFTSHDPPSGPSSSPSISREEVESMVGEELTEQGG